MVTNSSDHVKSTDKGVLQPSERYHEVQPFLNTTRLERTWRSECLVRDHGWAKVRDGDDTDGWIPSEVPTPSKSTDSVWSSTGMHINLILLS